MNEQSLEKRRLIGLNLAHARLTVNFTQAQVAVRVFDDVAKTKKISEIERGFRLPDAELLQTLCLLYGVSSDWVLGFNEAIELDPLCGDAGVLYVKLAEQIEQTINKISLELCKVGATHIPKLPKNKFLEIVNIILEIKDIYPNNIEQMHEKLKHLFKLANESKNILNKQDKLLKKQLSGLFEQSIEYQDSHNLITSLPTELDRHKAKHMLTLNKKRGAN